MVLQASRVSHRRITLSNQRLRADGKAPELLVHALAQLPDAVKAELPDATARRRELEVLADAYGVRDRLSFTTGVADAEPVDDMLAGSGEALGEVVERNYTLDDPPANTRRGDDSLFRGERIAIVTNFPAHYRLPLFGEIASRLEEAGASFHVFFCSRAASRRPWLAGEAHGTFEHTVLRSLAVPVRARHPLVPFGLGRGLHDFRPSIVVTGGFSPFASGSAARFARRHGLTFGLWSGETHATAPPGAVHRRVRASLTARADFAIAYGAASADRLRDIRRDLPLVIGRNTAPAPSAGGHAARKGPVEALFVGDLASPRKGADVAVRAVAGDPQMECRLTVVGGGSRLPELERLAAGDHRIRFTGPLAPRDVHRLYAKTDVFLFPTRKDVFGLALVEAMAAGLCVLTSEAPGALTDLVIDDRNGLVVRSDDPGAWSAALRRVTVNMGLRTALGAAAMRTIRGRWTVEHSADAMLAGFRLGLLSRGRKR